MPLKWRYSHAVKLCFWMANNRSHLSHHFKITSRITFKNFWNLFALWFWKLVRSFTVCLLENVIRRTPFDKSFGHSIAFWLADFERNLANRSLHSFDEEIKRSARNSMEMHFAFCFTFIAWGNFYLFVDETFIQ